MKKKIAIAALAVAGFAVSSSALADSSGLYVGGNLGASVYDTRDAGHENANDLAWGLHAGYAFNRYLAVEAGYQNFGKGEAGRHAAESRAYDASVRASLPLGERVSLFGKLGLAHIDADFTGPQAGFSDNEYGLKLGVGAEFKLTPALGLQAQLTQYRGGPRMDSAQGSFGKNTSLMSLGLNYQF